MSTPATAADATTSITMNPWETRAIEITLIVVGALVLIFAGFVAAYPLRLGTSSNTATTSTGPVTLSHLTTLGTTPSVVTEVTLTSTSSESSSRSTDSAWLGTIFGIGTLIVLSGALYRRVTSVSGFGVTINTSGVVNDPVVQAKVLDAIAKTRAGDIATPGQAALIYASTMTKLQRRVASRQVTVVPQTAPLGPRSRLSMFADRLTGPSKSTVKISAPVAPTDDEIAQAVDEAQAEILPD